MDTHQLLFCKICEKDYDPGVVDPLTLWCGHTYCRRCVSERFMQKHRTGTCPKLDCTGRLSSDPEWHPVTASLMPPLQERKLKCKNCDQHFTKLSVEPLTLDCGHSFCRTCVKVNTKSGNVKCPECKTMQFTIPENITIDLLQLSEEIPPRSLPDIEIKTKKGAKEGIRQSFEGLFNFNSEKKEKNIHPKLNRNRSEPIRRKQSKEESTVASPKLYRLHSMPVTGNKQSKGETSDPLLTVNTNTKL